MAVNYYDQAAEAPILNTYVPIDFASLLSVGKEQSDRIQKAADAFATSLQSFAEFNSPSEIDTKRWYDLTINRQDVQDLINRMVNDPDALKDAGFRASLSGAINRTDYAALSSLKQSREGLLARQKANQKLMEQGRYNPLLHDVNFAGYNTLQQGIYNDVSPLPYTSVVDMVKPYVDNLKPAFMGTSGDWIVRGVSNERTDAQVRNNWSNIVNTPGYAQNLELIKRQYPGISDDDAVNYLDSQIIRAGREFAYEDRERDPLALRRAAARAATEKTTSSVDNLTELVHRDLSRQSRLTELSVLNEIAPEALSDDAQVRYLNYGVDGLSTDEQKALSDNITPLQMIKRNMDVFYATLGGDEDVPTALNNVVAYHSSNIGLEASSIYTQQAAGNGKQYTDGSYEVSTISNFMPLDELGASMTNLLRYDNTLWNVYDRLTAKRTRLWTDSNVSAIVRPGGQTTSDNRNAYNISYMFIPFDQVNTGLDQSDPNYIGEEDVKNMGGRMVRRSFDESVSNTQRFDYEGNPDGSSSVNRGKVQTYIMFPVVNRIPDKGVAAIEADALFNQKTGMSSSLRDTQIAVSQRRRATKYSNPEGDEE